MIKSKALEVNIADYRVDVVIDPRYQLLQNIMSKYYGILDNLNTFLKELSHPYKNWQFIVEEARTYCLNYFHLFQKHPQGPEAADLLVTVFFDALESGGTRAVQTEAVDNLILFLHKIIKDAGAEIGVFKPVLDKAFEHIDNLPDKQFSLFVKSYYQLKRLAEDLLKYPEEPIDGYPVLNRLLIRYFQAIYDYWLTEEDPQTWFLRESGEIPDHMDLPSVFGDISLHFIQEMRARLESIPHSNEFDSSHVTRKLCTFAGYSHFVKNYLKVPQRLFDMGHDIGEGNRWKLVFLFRIMNISGLALIHEEALRSINRTLTWLIAHEDQTRVRKLIKHTFAILKKRADDFPATALNCVLNMGEGVYKLDDNDFVNFFTDFITDLGFQPPMIQGVGDDWQIKVNHDHIQNIRTWLRLIERKPQWSKRLLSALIIHLSISGVFIKDTDLFPREITRFLNSDIEPVYNLAKQLNRLFPAFFNNIGAEGELRDISTQIDEINNRKDILVHFLRKQSHVESSNRVINLMEAVFSFWQTKDKRPLIPYVPPAIYDQTESVGPYIDGIHRIMVCLNEDGIKTPTDLLAIPQEELTARLDRIPDAPPIDRQRILLARSYYKLLNQKYNLNFLEIDHYITQLNTEAFPDLDQLKTALVEPDLKRKIQALLTYLAKLKELILSPVEYEVREDIYQKRHITIDIPSMYGSYHELKFDAMGLTFRIESLLNVLFEELLDTMDLTLITKATFFQIYARFKLFDQALELEGIGSNEFKHQMEFLSHALQTRGFSYTQYLDIFKGFAQAVKNIFTDHFNNIHEQNLNLILTKIPPEQILTKYLPQDHSVDTEKLRHRVSEIFFREKIAMSLGLTQLDRLLSRVLNILFTQAEKLSKGNLHLLLNYDPQHAMTAIDDIGNIDYGIILLGNKGLNLIKLRSYGWPIPPGFIITTEVFRCREIIDTYGPADENFKQQVMAHLHMIEQKTGKKLGDPRNPLLFSVRSGSSISQPGMMDTLLNVGITETITEGIADHTGNAWFAWDNYRRFLQCHGMAHGLERNDFDAIINEYKHKLGIPFKSDFSGKQMKTVALAYRTMILEAGIEILEDPFKQLLHSIKNVFDSWESPKAKTYRKIMGISDDWGTAVTVQAMVFGNLSSQSGTGVLFTHSPRLSGDSLRLWGDFTVENQGEDVVSGLVKTLPISKVQQDMEQRETDITLETHFQEIYNTLKEYVFQLIYDRGWSPQEMEFTFEGPSRNDLYLLQTRDMSMRERKKVYIFDLYDVLGKDNFLGHGIGVSGGAMSGRIVFTLKEIEDWREKEPERSLILVRGDTVPDDILEIFASDGLLTARGGLTSHASVVAHRLEKTCVVGCGNLVCNEKQKTALFNGNLLKSGDFISIDGQEGSVYKGSMKVKVG